MDFEELRSRYEEWLDLEDDPGLLRILYGAACANFYRGNPVWVMFIGPAGCHRKGTDILMADGGTIKVEDVRINHRLMGPTGPKTVLHIVRGRGEMAEIVRLVGESFVVNMDHILTLVNRSTGKVIDISVRDYLVDMDDDLLLFKSTGERSSFFVRRLPEEDYYGFTLDGDGRYLMGDFTVTHNCGKTQLLTSLGTSENVVMVSTMTPNALVSGYNDPDASLIARLKDKILIIKDLSATTEINAEDRNLLFSILRDAYDGHVSKATGRGTIEFEGKFGILAAGTLAVEQGRKMEGLLGERFLYIRPRIRATRILERSLRNAVRKEEMNNSLKEAGATFLDSWRPPANGRTLPASVVEAAKEAASILVVARSGIVRDSYNKEVAFPAEVTELPTRVYEQMVLLLSAMRYLGAGRDELLATVRRLLCDSIPYVRLRVLQAIINKQDTVSNISTSIKLSRSYTDRTIADLESLNVIGKRNGKVGIEMPFLLNSLEEMRWD